MLCNAWVLGSDTNWGGAFSEFVFSSSKQRAKIFLLLTVNFGKKGKKSGGKGLVRIIFVCLLLLRTTTGTKIGALWLEHGEGIYYNVSWRRIIAEE